MKRSRPASHYVMEGTMIRTRIFTCLFYSLFSIMIVASNAPTNPTATPIAPDQIRLTWTDNSSDEIGFTFAYATNPTFTNAVYVWTGGVNVTSYTHTGRNAATTYYYKIKAEGSPDSSWTSIVSATTSPSGLALTPTSSSTVSLAWTGNAANTDITGYTYAYANNSAWTGATYVWVAGANASNTSRSGLATATTYWVKIKAEGAVDSLDSPFGPAVAATTTPAGPTATVVSATQIDVSWTGNASNSNIVGYTVAKATNSSFTNATYHYTNGAGATLFSSTGLSSGTTYYYKVKAEGTSDAYDSPFTAAITASTSSAPNPPSALTATTVSSSQINLGWTDNSTNEIAFELKRATDSSFTQNVVWIGGIQGTTYSNTGLAANTTYHYKVRAKGTGADSAYSSPASATTQTTDPTIPQPPSALTVSSVSSSSVTLTWTDNSNNETGFEVKRATDSAFTQGISWVGSIGAPPYTSPGLSPGATYYFKVRAEGVAGKSAYSNTVNATTAGAVSGGTAISPRFFGLNAWMPAQISGTDKGGHLGEKWIDIRDSKPRMIRYGGIAVDKANPDWKENSSAPACDPTDAYETAFEQYAQMVDDIRGAGAEPILQVPVDANLYAPEQAAALVQCINGTLQKNVIYWSIGNEPNHEYSYGSAQIAEYIRRFAPAMKTADTRIKILAPELAGYSQAIMTDLLCGAQDISNTFTINGVAYYYVDVVTFHDYQYPKNGGSTWPTSRADVIGALSGFRQNLIDLSDRVATCNGTRNRTGEAALKIAVTEANINYDNPPNESQNNLDGYGAAGFIGGQFWADIMGVSMLRGVDMLNFWSIIEGNNAQGDKGYLCRDLSTYHPSYYHFLMMAEHFRGNIIEPSDNQGNVKTYAAKDTDQVVVILINQDMASFNYTVRLDTTPVTNALTVNVAANIAAQKTGTLAGQSTLLLVFDSNGALKKTVEYKRSAPDAPQTLYY